MITRTEVEKYIFDKYAVIGEYPWAKYPQYEVFRHEDNRKWFAVFIRIPISKLGILENRQVNIINLKIGNDVFDLLWQENGIFPAYHMNKEHWVSVLLDGSVSFETVKTLLDASYNATMKKQPNNK